MIIFNIIYHCLSISIFCYLLVRWLCDQIYCFITFGPPASVLMMITTMMTLMMLWWHTTEVQTAICSVTNFTMVPFVLIYNFVSLLFLWVFIPIAVAIVSCHHLCVRTNGFALLLLLLLFWWRYRRSNTAISPKFRFFQTKEQHQIWYKPSHDGTNYIHTWGCKRNDIIIWYGLWDSTPRVQVYCTYYSLLLLSKKWRIPFHFVMRARFF